MGPGPAIEFYFRGELVRSYEVPDLVTFPALIDETDWLSDTHLQADSQNVGVETRTGERYIFDVHTGEIVSRFRQLRYAVVAIVVTIGAIGVFTARRRQLRRRKEIGAV